MHEVAVDGGKIVAAGERIDEMLAHANQRHGAAGSKVEPAQQFLPAGLRRDMDAGRGHIRRAGPPGVDRGGEPSVVGAEFGGECLEERDPGT